MNIKILYPFVLLFFSAGALFAQTPTVLTLKASGVSSTEIPEGTATINISAALNGSVNANGTTCTVSFEYGRTTSYGNTISANPVTVTGSYNQAVSANVNITYVSMGSEERLIHYRLKVVNENGTCYGRDFIATPIDPTRNIAIMADCSDSPTLASFNLMNRSYSIYVTVDYSTSSLSGYIIIGPQQVQTVFVGKSSVCSFSYHYQWFRQVLTNDQRCSETLLPKQKIFMTATGKIASDKFLYRIENGNGSSVNINILNGSTYYPYTIAPQSVAYFVGYASEVEISTSDETFAASCSRDFNYEGMAWLSVTPLSTTATTASFELYNRDDAAHTFVLRNNGGTEYSYTLAAYESRTVTLSNENWNVYTTIWDPTGMNYGGSWSIYTGPAFGDAASFYNGLLKVAAAIPGSAITASVAPASIASSTSLTLNGVISNSAFANTDVEYHFIYGTNPNTLNQSTSTQSGTVQAFGSVNVNATISGLTAETLYYYKLVSGTNQSSVKKIFLSTAIPTTNLKLHLRSDLAVTSSSSAVSTWGDVSGFDSDASQAASGNQPTIVDNVINGKSVLRFNGTTSKMSLPTSATLGVQSNPYGIFIVGKSSSGDIQFLIGGGATEQFEYHLNGAAGARFIPISSTFIDKGSAGNYTDGNAHVFSARASSTGGAVRVDGVEGGTSSGNILSTNSGNLLLGVRSGNSYFFNGDLAEVIIYNSVLSGTDRNTIEQYLSNRYNITTGALPVELTSFTASAKNTVVELQWNTATEQNNFGFEVQRSVVSSQPLADSQKLNADGWSKVGFVEGAGTSNTPKNYSFTDKSAAGKYLYRLKQIDRDGKFTFSNTVEVTATSLPTVFALMQNFPNPFNPTTAIHYQLPVNSQVTLAVYDILGNEVATLVNETKEAGTYTAQFDGAKLSSGMYFYTIKAGIFTATNKLLLMK